MIQYFDPLSTAFQALESSVVSVDLPLPVPAYGSPCSIGVLMKGAPTPFWAYYQPTTIRSLLPKHSEEVFPKAFRGPILPLIVFANHDLHFLDKTPIEQVKWAFISVVVHIFHVCLEWPIDSFRTKFNITISCEKRFCGPFLVRWPLSDFIG